MTTRKRIATLIGGAIACFASPSLADEVWVRDQEAIVNNFPKDMQDYAACVVMNAASAPYGLPQNDCSKYVEAWSISCSATGNPGNCRALQDKLTREVAGFARKYPRGGVENTEPPAAHPDLADEGMVYAIFVCSTAWHVCEQDKVVGWSGPNGMGGYYERPAPVYRTVEACKAAAAKMQSQFTPAMLSIGDYAICKGKPTWRNVD